MRPGKCFRMFDIGMYTCIDKQLISAASYCGAYPFPSWDIYIATKRDQSWESLHLPHRSPKTKMKAATCIVVDLLGRHWPCSPNRMRWSSSGWYLASNYGQSCMRPCKYFRMLENGMCTCIEKQLISAISFCGTYPFTSWDTFKCAT